MMQEKQTNRQTEQGKAETEIPCAVCRDLIPLVQDGVASPESEALEQTLVINKRNDSGKREYDIFKERLPIGDHQRISEAAAIRHGIEEGQI